MIFRRNCRLFYSEIPSPLPLPPPCLSRAPLIGLHVQSPLPQRAQCSSPALGLRGCRRGQAPMPRPCGHRGACGRWSCRAACKALSPSPRVAPLSSPGPAAFRSFPQACACGFPGLGTPSAGSPPDAQTSCSTARRPGRNPPWLCSALLLVLLPESGFAVFHFLKFIGICLP